MNDSELKRLNEKIEIEQIDSVFPKSVKPNTLKTYIVTIRPREIYQVIINSPKLKGKWLKNLDKLGYLVEHEVNKSRITIFTVKRRHF